MPRSKPVPGADPDRWRAFAVCLLAGFMTLLDVSVVNVALPSVQAGLRTSSAQLSWVVAGYTLAFGLALVPSGRLGDGLGRRRMFLAGLAAFTVLSMVCGVSVSGTWLVCARLGQGVAGGMLTPQVVGLMQQLFQGRERGRAAGFYGAMVAAATAVGPLVGGLLLRAAGSADGWRWVFFVNLPIGVVTFALAFRLLPQDGGQRQAARLDLAGVVLLGAGVAAIILPLIRAEDGRGHVRWSLLGLGPVLLACFVGWERHHRRRKGSALVDLHLLRHRPYAIGTLIGVVYFAGYTGLVFVLSLYFQRGLGYSALAAGAAGAPFSIGSSISAAFGGRATHRFGRPLVVVGTFTVALALVGMGLLVRHHHRAPMWLVLCGPLLVAGLGSGLVIGPNLTLALQRVPPTQGGTAAAVLQTAQRIGSAFGLAVVGSAFLGTLAASHGDSSLAVRRGLFISAVLVGVALLAAVADVLGSTRGRRQAAS
ncbi:MFS transporter [Actinoallomurus sp. NPDC052274]|uniref:MFS transporter n=1 Tax=Actinoallomurus sp. NPDC052274 TaxID=3155420 RepID=UPI0034284A91